MYPTKLVGLCVSISLFNFNMIVNFENEYYLVNRVYIHSCDFIYNPI